MTRPAHRTPRRPAGPRARVGGARALAVAEAVGFLVPLAVLPYLTRRLGIVAYGELQFVMALGMFAGLVADPGLGRVALRRSAREGGRVARLLGRLQPLRFAAALLASAVLLAGAWLFPATSAVRLMVALQGGVTVAQAMNVDGYLAGVGQVAWTGWVRATVSLLYGALVLLLVRTPADAPVVLGITVATSLGAAAASAGRLARTAGPWRWAPTVRTSRILLGEGVGFALASAMSLVYARIDVLMLEAFRGEAAVGLYASAVRVTEAPLAVIGIVTGVLLPVAIAAARTSSGRCTAYGQRALRLAGAFAVPAAAGCAVAGGPILAWIAGPEFAGADATMAVLGLATAAGTAASVASSFGLTALGRSRDLFLATATGAALNALANLAAIPWFGTAGAAATTVLAQCAVLVVVLRRSRDRFAPDLVRAWRGWALPAAVMAACVLAARLAGARGGVLLAVGVATYPVAVAGLRRLTRGDRRALLGFLGRRT